MPNEPHTTDTSPDAAEVQLGLWREMTGRERVRKAMVLSSRLRAMAFDAIRRRHPEYNEGEVQLKFIELAYGHKLAADFKRWKTERSVEPA